MGTEVISANQNDSKFQMSVAPVVAGATVIVAGEMVVFIGNLTTPGIDLAGRGLEIITALEVCRNALREEGFPEPAGEDIVQALLEVGKASSAVIVTNQVTFQAAKEIDVFVAYKAGYSGDGRTAMFMRRIDAAMDVMMESTLKAA